MIRRPIQGGVPRRNAVQRICILVAVVAGCVALGTAWWLVATPDGSTSHGPDSQAPGEAAVERAALAAVVAQVAAHGGPGSDTPPVRAAPRRFSNGSPVPQPETSSPSPPAGYAFAAHHGAIRTYASERSQVAFDRPDDDAPDWVGAVDALPRLVAQAEAANRDWSFGWIRLAPASRLADVGTTLAALGVVVEGSAGALLRARLPGDRPSLDAIAALPSVVALGSQLLTTKLPGPFAEQATARPAAETVPVFVTLMTDDPDGRWRGELERLGVVVGAYDADTRAYVATLGYGDLETVALADFVQFVEPVGIARAALDTAVPGMGADVLRNYEGVPGSFTGTAGAGVPVAVMDTGLNVTHGDIGSNRDSICGANFITPSREEDQDLWADQWGHGTHVTGTVVGTGAGAPHYAGMAPLVGDIRVAKVLDRRGLGPFTAINAGMDFLAEASECSAGGWSSDLVKPLIVNMSLSANALVFEGRDQSARKLDATVWGHRQLYVVAQANASIHGFSNYGAAKNSLAVGAVLDSGELASFSSHGPTADGRLAPLVVGTGVGVMSASGGGSPVGYRHLSGTSMASPAVAGVAALLMDAVPSHREQPALARARLMASAIKPDAWFDDASAFPGDNSLGPGAFNARFGLGKVSATTSVLTRDRTDGWLSGSFTATFEDGEYAYHDIEVPQGASRLDVVLTWDEPPSDVIADTVLNDLDLWLDEGGDCTVAQCGEHSSVSRRDNVEWVIVRSPPPGTWRLKVAARRVYTEPPRAALAWTVIRGPSTPELAVAADKRTLDASGEVALTVSANGYVAAGVRLQVECRTLAEQADEKHPGVAPCDELAWAEVRAHVTNADGSERPRAVVDAGGLVHLGDIAAGEARQVRITGFTHRPAGAALHFKATSWNATAASISVPMDPTTSEDAAAVEVPGNDTFAAAEVLEDGKGNRQVDILHAGTEPAEPDYAVGAGRPAGSVWYRWKATAAGPVHFGVALTDAFALRESGVLDGWETRVDVYEGDSLAGARTVASAPWGASFFAVPGTDYAVRLAASRRGGRIGLYWQRGDRPANDSFDAARAITGEGGREAGTNLGATLDPGEYHGGLSATVWYAWTAPDDGAWEFRSNEGQLKVLVFSGGNVGELRLVSGYPEAVARFQAHSGETYRIALAAKDAYSGGSQFDLSWFAVQRDAGNDDLGGVIEWPAEESSSWWASNDARSTVEPAEPPASGVRTRWWSWTAPSTGEVTWRITGWAGLSLAAFSGDSLETLQHLGTARDTRAEFTFPAEADETYRFAVGISNGHDSAFTVASVGGTVDFGPTPSNDAWSGAEVLAGAEGTVTGANRYATTEPYERIWDVGHSSVWWTFEAPADGWYRFWVEETHLPFSLSAYAHGTGPAGRLQMTVSSRPVADDGRIEIVVEAAAGNRYAIRLGTVGSAQGADFTLRWEQTDAPDFLRYLGRFTAHVDNAPGETVEVDGFGALAVDAAGTALYAASKPGLVVFARDVDSGVLTSKQFLSGAAAPGSGLLWDSDNARLLVFDGCEVRVHEAVDGTFTRLREDAPLPVSGESPCEIDRLFTDPEQAFVYAISRSSSIRVYAYEVDTLRHVQTLPLTINDAVITNAGTHVYAIEDYTLHALERDRDTGELAEVGQTSLANRARTLAVSADDSNLFAFALATAAFDLTNPAMPTALGSLTPQTQGDCSFAIARGEGHLADAFCWNSAYTVEWDADASRYAVADFVSSWQANRYGDLLPDFSNAWGFAASPDGRYAYVGTFLHGILSFERVGNSVVEVQPAAEDGYVRLGILKVAAGRIDFGPLSSATCIAVQNLSVNGVLYDVDTSKWQTRADANAPWADIAGTGETGEMCAYTPTSSGEYRLAVDMAIDGEPGKYASNAMAYQAQ